MTLIEAFVADRRCSDSARVGLLPVALIMLLAVAALSGLAAAGSASAATLSQGADYGPLHLEGGPQADRISASTTGTKITFVNQTGPLAFVFSDEAEDLSEPPPSASSPCQQVTRQKVSCEATIFGQRRITQRAPAVIVIDEIGAGDVFDAGRSGCDSEPIALYSLWNYAAGTAQSPAVIWGSPYEEMLIANGKAILHGCGGNDEFGLKGPGSSAYGEGGDDIAHLSASRAKAYGGAGRDQFTFSGFQRFSAAYGGPDHDSFQDGKGRQKMFGGPGDDWMLSGAGRDLLNGGAGPDELYASFKTRMHPPYKTLIPTSLDQLRCGPGRDSAYASRRSPVSGCEDVKWLPRKEPIALYSRRSP